MNFNGTACPTGRKERRNVKCGDTTPNVVSGILSPGSLEPSWHHELGHAKAWWELARPKIAAKITSLEGWVTDATIKNILATEHHAILLESGKKADEYTIQWFANHGYSVEKHDHSIVRPTNNGLEGFNYTITKGGGK